MKPRNSVCVKKKINKIVVTKIKYIKLFSFKLIQIGLFVGGKFFCIQNIRKLGTQRWARIESTPIQRYNVESTSDQFRSNVVCMLRQNNDIFSLHYILTIILCQNLGTH